MNNLLKLNFWRKQGLNFLLVGVALVAFGVAFWIHSQAKEALQTAKNNYQSQQAINLEAEQAAALLDEYLPPYRDFQAQGVIGAPQRLQWLETLNADVNEHLVPLLAFNLTSTVVASATNTTYAPDTLVMKVTPMRLDFTLLHEGDFYHLMTSMQRQAKGLFSAESCEIRRSEGEFASFKGNCELLWYSLADITHVWEVPDGNLRLAKVRDRF